MCLFSTHPVRSQYQYTGPAPNSVLFSLGWWAKIWSPNGAAIPCSARPSSESAGRGKFRAALEHHSHRAASFGVSLQALTDTLNVLRAAQFLHLRQATSIASCCRRCR